ncbi:MAG: oligosaccharide flippase family protein [Bacteroidales bacterium]|nr:oligosaccharide flippase family protein [Bacteroidales bacterium]
MRNWIDRIKLRIAKTLEQRFWKQLFTNMSTALLAEVGVTILTFGMTAVVIRRLGNTAYGVFVLALAFATMATRLTSFQTWQGVIKFGSEALVRSDAKRLQSILKVSWIIDFVFTALGIFLTWLLVPLIGSLMEWDASLIQYARWMSITLALNLSNTPTGLLRIMDRFAVITSYRILTSGMKLTLVVVGIYVMDLGIIGVVLGHVAGELLGIGYLYIRMACIIVKSSLVSVRDIMSSNISMCGRMFFRFSFWANLTNITDVPSKEFDAFVLSTISYDVVAVFKVFKQIGQVLYKLVNPISQAILPQFSELVAQNKGKECYRKMVTLRNKTLLLLIPLTLVLCVGSLIVLNFLFGEIYLTYWYVLLSFLLARAFALASASIHPLFVALNYVKKNVAFSLIANLVYMGSAVILVRQIGIMGIVVALSIEYVLMIGLKTYTLKKNFGD